MSMAEIKYHNSYLTSGTDTRICNKWRRGAIHNKHLWPHLSFLPTSILCIKGSKKSLGNNRRKLCNQRLYGTHIVHEYEISCWISQFGEERAKLPLWISDTVEVVVQPLCHMFTSIIDCVGQKFQTARSRTLSI